MRTDAQALILDRTPRENGLCSTVRNATSPVFADEDGTEVTPYRPSPPPFDLLYYERYTGKPRHAGHATTSTAELGLGQRQLADVTVCIADYGDS